MNNNRFAGKVAVVTGSGTGIGKAIARELLLGGASVVLNGRNGDRLRIAEEELKLISQQVISVCSDMSEREGANTLIDATLDAFGRIDMLICNAGLSMRGRVADLDPGVFRSMFEANVMTAVCPVIAALPFLRESKGSIVFISSLAGIRGLPFLSAYSATKMALRAFAESIRIEEAGSGIHVGLVYAGVTVNDPGKETIAADGSRIILAPRSGKGVQSQETVARSVIRNLLKRRFITVLTMAGKLNYYLQPLLPGLVEFLLIKNIRKFEEGGR